MIVYCLIMTRPNTLFLNDITTTEIYTLSLHDALPISRAPRPHRALGAGPTAPAADHRRRTARSEEHTSELQSHHDLVCRLLLEKKKRPNSNSPLAKLRGNGLNRSK